MTQSNRRLLFVGGLLIILMTMIGGALILGNDYFLKRPGGTVLRSPLNPPGELFSVTNPGGLKLTGAWYQGKTQAPVILLCHGHGGRMEVLADMVAFLRGKGFPLLLFDFRAHGRSEGDYTSLGLHEWEDIDAVLKAAEQRGFFSPGRPLVAFGRSLGAAALANGASRLPRIQAFILESMYPELRTVAGNDAKSFYLPDSFIVDLFFWVATQRTGIRYFDSRPSERITGVYPRPLLLIHNARDIRVPDADFQRLTVIASWASTAVFPEAQHVKGHVVEPERFEREFLGFLASAGFAIP